MSKVKTAPSVEYGSSDYHQLVRPLLLEVHGAYAGRVTFHWLNEAPYFPEEEYDWFVAGCAFGGVLRTEHGGQGVWQDMHLAWLDDLYRAIEELGVIREVELDGNVLIPYEYVSRLVQHCFKNDLRGLGPKWQR